MRPSISNLGLAVGVALFLLAAANLTFWHKAWQGFATAGGLASFAIATVLVFVSAALVLSHRYVAKPAYILAILSAAGASYFTDTFGTVVNANMLDNVLSSNASESGEFLTPGLVWHLVLFGLLPSIAVSWVRVDYPGAGLRVRRDLPIIVLSLAIAGVLIGANWAETRAAMRHDFRALMGTLNPPGPISSAFKVAATIVKRRNAVKDVVGEDAQRGPWITGATKPVVTVIVAGESARAMNFSLNGYARNTNPVLSKLPVLNFSNVTSCGTETGISLPCMFSDLGRANFSKEASRNRQSLMNVFDHASIDVLWWDNDGGDKGVADGVAYQSYMLRNDPDRCDAGTCQDDIFLDDLDGLLATVKRDTVVVLHQRGSHGPAYYLRYPETFRPFQPDCRQYDPTACSMDELVNAYDNTIAYNDRFLGRVISILEKYQTRAIGSMVYVSDHGESLGENGLYMHGTPYERAPAEQTHVPLIVWTAPQYQSLSGLDVSCAKGLGPKAFSHDNVYHTLLGMMNVRTKVYNPALDMLATCRAEPSR